MRAEQETMEEPEAAGAVEEETIAVEEAPTEAPT